jgi:broad specificity phosphatase PhoE
MYPFRIPKAYLKRVLLVAGESHTKKTLKIFTDKLKELGAGEIRNCVFYKQTLPESQMASNVEIHYFGISRKKDYLMPWQTESSLHPSENKEDAEAQNAKIGRYVTEVENCFDAEESGFYSMRHAETEANAKDVFIGSGTDIPLTEIGKEQARNVGRYFKSIGVTLDTIYYSPMIRCYETAREISSIVGGQMIPDKRIKELDYGDWEGLSRNEIESKYAEDYKKYCTDMSFRPTGSTESANDVAERVTGFLHELMASNATMGKQVLVVTHKTAGRILLQVAGHNPGGHFRDIPFENAAIGYVSIKLGKTSVILDNKRC